MSLSLPTEMALLKIDVDALNRECVEGQERERQLKKELEALRAQVEQLTQDSVSATAAVERLTKERDQALAEFEYLHDIHIRQVARVLVERDEARGLAGRLAYEVAEACWTLSTALLWATDKWNIRCLARGAADAIVRAHKAKSTSN